MPPCFSGGEMNMPENRIQQLIDAGVAENPSAFTHQARQVIQALSEEEFDHLLAIRAKVIAGGHGNIFDHCITEAI
jgi:predicted oxidoreductase (fatty acid repression mutant protein)